VKRASIQILLTLVTQYKFEIDQLDMKTAFLYGDLEEKNQHVSADRIQDYKKRTYDMQVEKITLWIKAIAKAVV